MWDISPLRRPLAFTIGYTLDRIPFTLPHTVVQRIIYFSATTLRPNGGEVDKREWVERCDLLRSLCLVSRACRDRTLPFLYGKIRLDIREEYTSLIGTLACTGDRVNALNPVFTAHGRLVKILVIELDEDTPWGTVCSLDLRPLLQMMPEMRCMVISPSKDLYLPISMHLMSTLEIRGRPSSLLGKKILLQELSFVQRLSIKCTKRSTSSRLYDSHISSDNFFPNLQAISIMGDASHPQTDFAETLEAMAGWTMPHLTSVHLNCLYPTAELTSNLFTFLRAHSHTIQDLTFAEPPISVSQVLSRCPNLRSLVIVTSEFALPQRFPRHLNLERIVIRANLDEVIYAGSFAPYFLQIEAFRGLSLSMFTKLYIAEFTWGTWSSKGGWSRDVSASFKVGTDAVVINGNLYRKLI